MICNGACVSTADSIDQSASVFPIDCVRGKSRRIVIGSSVADTRGILAADCRHGAAGDRDGTGIAAVAAADACAETAADGSHAAAALNGNACIARHMDRGSRFAAQRICRRQNEIEGSACGHINGSLRRCSKIHTVQSNRCGRVCSDYNAFV